LWAVTVTVTRCCGYVGRYVTIYGGGPRLRCTLICYVDLRFYVDLPRCYTLPLRSRYDLFTLICCYVVVVVVTFPLPLLFPGRCSFRFCGYVYVWFTVVVGRWFTRFTFDTFTLVTFGWFPRFTTLPTFTTVWTHVCCLPVVPVYVAVTFYGWFRLILPHTFDLPLFVRWFPAFVVGYHVCCSVADLRCWVTFCLRWFVCCLRLRYVTLLIVGCCCYVVHVRCCYVYVTRLRYGYVTFDLITHIYDCYYVTVTLVVLLLFPILLRWLRFAGGLRLRLRCVVVGRLRYDLHVAVYIYGLIRLRCVCYVYGCYVTLLLLLFTFVVTIWFVVYTTHVGLRYAVTRYTRWLHTFTVDLPVTGCGYVTVTLLHTTPFTRLFCWLLVYVRYRLHLRAHTVCSRFDYHDLRTFTVTPVYTRLRYGLVTRLRCLRSGYGCGWLHGLFTHLRYVGSTRWLDVTFTRYGFPTHHVDSLHVCCWLPRRYTRYVVPHVDLIYVYPVYVWFTPTFALPLILYTFTRFTHGRSHTHVVGYRTRYVTVTRWFDLFGLRLPVVTIWVRCRLRLRLLRLRLRLRVVVRLRLRYDVVVHVTLLVCCYVYVRLRLICVTILITLLPVVTLDVHTVTFTFVVTYVYGWFTLLPHGCWLLLLLLLRCWLRLRCYVVCTLRLRLFVCFVCGHVTFPRLRFTRLPFTVDFTVYVTHVGWFGCAVTFVHFTICCYRTVVDSRLLPHTPHVVVPHHTFTRLRSPHLHTFTVTVVTFV